MPRRTPAQGLARLGYLALTAATAGMDAAPARVRFGHGRTLSRLLFDRRPLVRLAPVAGAAGEEPVAVPADGAGGPPLRCALVTASLDVGGVESVVATLARHLPAAGVATTVLAREGGRTADELRAAGVDVRVVPDDERLAAAVVAADPDVVEVHTATPGMGDALVATGLPLVSVLHSVELYRSPDAWTATARLDAASRGVVAVSRTVRDDHVAHVPGRRAEDVAVVPNGTSTVAADDGVRARARARLGGALGVDLDADVVVACLARYDIQKNVPGLVDAFLLAARRRPDLRLVVAGGTADWLERARADALRRGDPNGDRVHLLAESDAATLLAASDAFALDSFFEGWPVSVTEAVRAGLPVVMADVGGAHELVGEGGAAGRVVANPAGPRTTRAAVEAARRRVHQRTRAAFAGALLEVADLPRSPRTARFGHGAMVAGHAGALRAAASTEGALR